MTGTIQLHASQRSCVKFPARTIEVSIREIDDAKPPQSLWL